ncbi:MAG: alpha/beta fold hydrolase [Anaerolineae bacterium]|nr:alpha/beta fold hydrolase [Anaerolineae bacterium]
MKRFFVVLMILLMVGFATSSSITRAQPDSAQAVNIEGADSLIIKGYYFAPSGTTPAPAILLLHQNGSSKREWNEVAKVLAENGYATLAVDQRGFGETKGKVDWKLAEQDVTLMFAWLRAQEGIDPERVAVMGGSIGSNMALRGCAADDGCKAVIALSPGLNYFGVTTGDLVDTFGLKDKAVFLVAAQRDHPAIDSVRSLTSQWKSGNLTVRLYDSSYHGVSMINLHKDLLPMIIDWLATYN